MKVNVLMSTYNGERYLQEQIDSIMKQEDVEVDLLVRDDGSKDATINLLDEFKKNGIVGNWYQGQNLGPAYSFLDLLSNSSDDADYFAFSDQDDFWKPEKLRVAVNMLSVANDVPALYFSRTQMTDANLNPIGMVCINPLLTFGESLVYEFIPGCTMVMNKRLRDIVKSYNPAYLFMHDVWIYSVAQAVGARVFFDKQSHILYRQHGNNTIGQGYSCWHEWRRRYHRFINGEHSRYRRACEIKNGYFTMMSNENKAILDAFINAKTNMVKRINLCLDERFKCANASVKRFFNTALLLNIY